VKLKTKSRQKTNAKTKSKTKPKEKDEESSEEEEPSDDEDLNKMLMKEAYEMEHLANEEIVDEEPDFFPYAIRDSAKIGPYEGSPRRPEDVPQPYEEQEYQGVAPSDLNKMSDAELDDMLSGLDGGGPSRSGGGGPVRRPTAPSTGSILSSMLPKLSMGLSASHSDSFGNDPFFSGFRRSMQFKKGEELEVNLKMRLPTSDEEQLFQEMIKRKIKKRKYINRMKKELANVRTIQLISYCLLLCIEDEL
jgi:hypothetical protein